MIPHFNYPAHHGREFSPRLFSSRARFLYVGAPRPAGSALRIADLDVQGPLEAPEAAAAHQGREFLGAAARGTEARRRALRAQHLVKHTVGKIASARRRATRRAPGAARRETLSSARRTAASRSSVSRATWRARPSMTFSKPRLRLSLYPRYQYISDFIAHVVGFVVRRVVAPRDAVFPRRRAQLGAREIYDRGRTMLPRRSGIPRSPASPVPRARFRSCVSTTSSALCPTAMNGSP